MVVASAWLGSAAVLAGMLCLAAGGEKAGAEAGTWLGESRTGLRLRATQQWGELGRNAAACAPGGKGSPLRIGDKTFAQGLGHHANGEIVIDLRGEYVRFRSQVGVQWQGGAPLGSVVFRVAVDGVVRWEAGPLTSSDPARRVELPLAGARELRLIASDAGDGIGCDMANWAEACLEEDPRRMKVGEGSLSLNGEPAPLPSRAAAGVAVVARAQGPQAALLAGSGMLVASLKPGEAVRLTIPLQNLPPGARLAAEAGLVCGDEAEICLDFAGARAAQTISGREPVCLRAGPFPEGSSGELSWTLRARGGETGVRLQRLRCDSDQGEVPLPLLFADPGESIPPPALPELRPPLEQTMIEWDWRMQDGIGTPREARSWQQAVGTVLERGDRLLEHLQRSGVPVGDLASSWETGRREWLALGGTGAARGGGSEAAWESLWRRVHALRRQIVLRHPAAATGPLLFVKAVPSSFSHQLTQYAGRCARPGGGLFVLDRPGTELRCRRLVDLPPGSCQSPDVSWDGRRVLFAHCATAAGSPDGRREESQRYHLFEVAADGTGLRQLTRDDCDDISPRYLPNGEILFLSTRRGGFHRCGRGPCPVHTLALAQADGSGARVVSFHETHEWDPAVLQDGRVIYTRWDYVDRNAVYYQQLWSVRPDGSDVRAYYGNNTLNPVGVWEARAVPGSRRVMATAAAHHAMTAGSIILLDIQRGTDGLAPIQRLTPDALFPESEFPVQRWHAPAGLGGASPEVPAEERRWPGHCYRTPWPLGEDLFLVAYSFEPLLGEPLANAANLFGLYLADRFGNKELIHRDPAIGSLWPIPLAARPRPPVLRSSLAAEGAQEGTFYLQDVAASWPSLGGDRARVKRLRILQILPKTTPHANSPRVGLAHASPGKQVLGTVPVEPDGSAYFRAPAGIPLAFQALDETGAAIQTMRSATYLQPGERVGCVGCHEHREAAPAARPAALAGCREPSAITPGPDGSKPFNYALLVQPVLDAKCVACHQPGKTEGGVDLTGAPAGEFTQSYEALARLVAYSEWKGTPQANFEPVTEPGRFGARASRLLRLLREGHHGAALSPAEMERLITWMDANALFYGTFEVADQARQRRGERIAGPALE